MSNLATLLGSQSSGPGTPPHAPHTGSAPYLWPDRWLRGAVVLCALLIGYQLAVTVLRPAWIGPATDWFSTAISWLGVLVVVFVSLRLSRARWPGVLCVWMWSAGLLCHAIGQSIWTVQEQLFFHHGLLSPNLPDVFFLLQYPFFILGVLLIPRTRLWSSRLIISLDCLLFMGAAAALSWYFILKPLYMVSGITVPTRVVILAYPMGDLFILFGLTEILVRPCRYNARYTGVVILVAAMVCLIIADSWAAWLEIRPEHIYTTGYAPDLFWNACYLLIPLAALTQLRLAQFGPPQPCDQPTGEVRLGTSARRTFLASLRFLSPFLVALLASAAILVGAAMTEMYLGWTHLIPAIVVSFGLLAVVIVRQEIIFLNLVRLYQEREMARANEQAMRELNRRKDEFLGIVSHEIKTPLASLRGYTELMTRRFNAWRPSESGAEDLIRLVALTRTALEYAADSVRRITRLVNDLLDDARIREGNLALNLEPHDLNDIVRNAVEEQRVLAPGRTIRLEAPVAQPVHVKVDAARIEQVINNFLTNALKYSKQDRPIEVRLAKEDDFARVTVRDEGVGLSVSEQARVWERFHQIAGVEVQSGSEIGLGIGLHISKSIIQAHDGQIGVESAPGQGSAFWFTLPLICSSHYARGTIDATPGTAVG